MNHTTVSIVLSVYNEAGGLQGMWERLHAVLDTMPTRRFEVIWVNDGSSDGSQQVIDTICTAPHSPHIAHVALEFSRNFGHEAAMIAGIDNASGAVLICMDADGQHPPPLLPAMLAACEQGAEIVLMERKRRADNGFIKNTLSKTFYLVINALSVFRFQENSTDFFLLAGPVPAVLRDSYRERNRFIRGFIQSIGFRKVVLPFEAPGRIHGGSSYSYRGLLQLGLNAVFSFSSKPLRLSVLVTLVFLLFTLVFAAYSLYKYLVDDRTPSGYTTIVLFLSVSFSVLFTVLTILSLYFSKAIQEMRQRPIYIIRKRSG